MRWPDDRCKERARATMESQPPEGHDRAARRRSRSLIADLDAVVWEADAATGTFAYVSDGIERILGLAPTAWMRGREGWLASIHPEDRDLVDDARARAAATGLAFDLTYRLVGADGDPVRVRDLGHVVPAEGDRPPMLRGIIVPATDDGPGAELLDTEARYRTLIEQLPAIVYSEDIESDRLRLVYVNPRVQELLGITPEEWIADAGVWFRMIHPDDLDRVRHENERTEATGEPFSIEYRMIARDGRVVWFRDEAVLVCDEADGTPRYWQGVMIDITDRKVAETQLAAAEPRYRALVEQTPTITYIDALEGPASTIYISPQTTTILGYSPQDWYDDPNLWSTIVHPEDRERTASPDPDLADAVYRLVARDGRVVWVHDQARLITDDAGEPMYWQGVLVDITEQKRAEALEADLASERQTAHELREADELKNTFLQAVAHDLRSPLTAILGLSGTLERDEIDLDRDDTRDFARRITANAQRMDRLVADMLDLERLAGGVLRPVLLPLDVGALVREMAVSSGLATHRRLDLETPGVTIHADRAMVERIVDNLLTNTAKHTPEEARIWVRVEPLDGGAVVVVEDDGPGVPAEDRDAIFEPFRQGSVPDRSTGVGVGLALVARFAALHGGRAWVEEREGGGASFHVFLSSSPDATSTRRAPDGES
ncbi:MAG: sensor histidine kinase [Actinomycetota bacterium]